jgi:hypothetical protein
MLERSEASGEGLKIRLMKNRIKGAEIHQVSSPSRGEE